MPGNVCSTTTCAPGVTPSASRRSARPSTVASTSVMTPRASRLMADNGTLDLELNAKEMEDIVESRSGQDRHWRDDADDGHAGSQSAFANHHQEIGDAWYEQRHHGERDDGLHPGQLPAMCELEQAGGAVVPPQKAHHEHLRGR